MPTDHQPEPKQRSPWRSLAESNALLQLLVISGASVAMTISAMPGAWDHASLRDVLLGICMGSGMTALIALLGVMAQNLMRMTGMPLGFYKWMVSTVNACILFSAVFFLFTIVAAAFLFQGQSVWLFTDWINSVNTD